MKIIIDDKIPFMRGRLEPFAQTVYLPPDAMTREAAAGADALIVRTRTACGKDLLEGSGVKLVVTATIGTDHIDLPWCASHGIEVRNCAGCNAPGVAQYVWSALANTGFDPMRHTLGVVGHGNVGSIVAGWGERFGARVLVCDPFKEAAGCATPACGYTGMERILAECDAVTLHVPLLQPQADGKPPVSNAGLFGEAEMESMKPGALLVNTSRGPVADNNAWARAIASGRIRGVADVWEGEPAISRLLLSLVEYGTPHIAGYSLEGKQRATGMALEAIGGFFGFKAPVDGLAPPYSHGCFPDSPQAVAASYDIAADCRALREDPEAFEQLRSQYNYRKECPAFQ